MISSSLILASIPIPFAAVEKRALAAPLADRNDSAQHRLDQAKFLAAKSQLAKELRTVSTNFGLAFL